MSDQKPPLCPFPILALAICLGVMAVLSCGVPFVPPLVFVAVPLAGAAHVLLGRVVLRRPTWTWFRAACAVGALALNALALYLALGRHHLIDWLEGH
ncbi:MAG: hypothetical protein ACKODH_14555 [Limisphaerales bacterium]